MLQVTNYEKNDVRNYDEAGPKTDFQKFISLKRSGKHYEHDRFGITTYLLLMNILVSETLLPICDGDSPRKLFDHQPLELAVDDLERISYIPKKKVRQYFSFCFKHSMHSHFLFILLYSYCYRGQTLGICLVF